MTGSSAVDDADLVALLLPAERFRRWVGDRLPGSGPFEVERITTGHSNELFSLRRGGGEWLLRRPPRTPLAPGAHDVLREARVLEAIGGSDVPAPRPLLIGEDADVLGAPFVVMDRIDGTSPYHQLPSWFDGPTHGAATADALIDALAAIHLVDWQAAGLGELGRPDGYAARQVGRWMAQWERYASRPLPDLLTTAAWLTEHQPTSGRTSLIHGDYGLHNVLLAPRPPVRLVAVLDWETATIGDPLCDLGYLLGNWLEPDETSQWFASAPPHPTGGFPSRDALVARYEHAVGRPTAALDWYRALGRLKIAVILEGSYARYLAGTSDDPYFADLEAVVPNLAAQAAAITRGAA